MPTYSYECLTCGSIMKVFQKMSEDSLKYSDCIQCKKKKKVQRIISGGSGMIFKGSGFYLTDYTEYGKNKKEPKEKDGKKDKNKDNKKNTDKKD